MDGCDSTISTVSQSHIHDEICVVVLPFAFSLWRAEIAPDWSTKMIFYAIIQTNTFGWKKNVLRSYLGSSIFQIIRTTNNICAYLAQYVGRISWCRRTCVTEENGARCVFAELISIGFAHLLVTFAKRTRSVNQAGERQPRQFYWYFTNKWIFLWYFLNWMIRGGVRWCSGDSITVIRLKLMSSMIHAGKLMLRAAVVN